MPRPDIQAIGAKWIAELRLQDRIITIRYTTNLCDPFGNLVYGLMTIQNLDEGRFLIEVQDPSTWPAGGSRVLSAESIEEGIVHELVHIRYADLLAHNTAPAAIMQEERATWATARALVRANKPTRAAIVRAMMAKRKTSAPMSAHARRMAMIDAATAKQILDALQGDDVEAMKTALRGIVESALTGGDNGPASVPNPMPQGAGELPEKDKPPMAMVDEKKPDQMMRSMKIEFDKKMAEMDAAIAIVRPAAKTELVRSMRAEGLPMTKAAEDEILNAPTLEAAKERAKGMRAMVAPGAKRTQALPPTGGNTAGLTRAQAVEYNRLVASGSPRAELYRSEALKDNEAAKAGAK